MRRDSISSLVLLRVINSEQEDARQAPFAAFGLNILVYPDSSSGNVTAKEDLMEDTKTQPAPEQNPEEEPVQVIQFADGYMEIFSKTHIAFGSGKSPWSVKES